ncbi:hypothetical protein B0H16DRAFT_1448414 [Mycena metata]|uniref:CxC2-like cysteine cluster KDZ transposase-associated domain-containing protein n=1 Tax=Mycena metata TaxID=1033252 RepID=A0AAD7NY59_9AGAR|nr:hypothetical protein B0H16DRAFT_1448414 [Mycena metata]
MESENFSYLCGDEGDWANDVWTGRVQLAGGEEEDDAELDGITLQMPTGGMGTGEGQGAEYFKRWENADKPMQLWVRLHRNETLDEMLRGEGRGAPEFYSHCAGCKAADPLFRCARQTCIGPGLYCETCIASMHRELPTHMLESGEFFRPLTLNDLDVEARLQLGHAAGTFCPRSRRAHKDFVIIDILGIRIVKLSFCGCDSTVSHRQQLMQACLWPATSVDPQTCATVNAIRLFEVQNCLGKISAYDFVRSLELLSNNDGLETVAKGEDGEEKGPPDRRRAFRAIVKQYRMMELRKRAGIGHRDSGIEGTKQGELAEPMCRMCPVPEVNLPEGYDKIDWDAMDEDQRYKYFLALAQDANFKLINRNVSSEAADPIVDDGSGFLCNRKEYSEHIRKHVDEDEISSCSGFQAMFLANAKRAKGVRVTGVGGGSVRDLQKGERFCNMDFLFFASLLGFILTYLIASYDIICQFSKHIWTRMEKLPAKYHLKIDFKNVRWAVPNFHLPAHKKGCHSPFSFHWLWGAGRTHSETVEQNWEFLNGIAAATKMMGLGARHIALEGLFSFHNWHRLVAHRRLLKQRMAEGIKDGRAHRDAFKAFNEGLLAVEGLDVAGWKTWVDTWERTQHVEGDKGSPYEFVEDGVTLKEIKIMLVADEYTRTGDGTEVEREDTPSTFLTMGLDIEEAQRQLTVAIKAAGPNPSPTQELDFLKRRTSVRVRIQAFRKLQGTYMPKLRQYLTQSQKKVCDADDLLPEATRLFMPSDLSSDKAREKACATGLDGVEARLRTGEAGDALGDLRQGLRVRTMTNRFKIRNWTGQQALTRGQGILRQVNIKIHASKLRYRYARQALLKLKGHGDWEDEFRVLGDDDVRGLSDRAIREEDQAHDVHLGALGVAEGLAATGVVALGEGGRSLSWIWYAPSTRAGGDKRLHDALRVEWCKAYSRANRWREDLVLVEEEMRRMIEFGRFAERRWKERAEARTIMLGKTEGIDPVVMEDVRAYALEQADQERRIYERVEVDWSPLRAKAAAYLRGEEISGGAEVVVVVDEDQMRWAESQVYAEEEGENDMYQ